MYIIINYHVCNGIFFLQDIPKPLLSQFVLDVELKELYIQAGLMDRVIQVEYSIVHSTHSAV